jgi:16S rRNA G966 N2-methylase RsmD
MIFTKSSQASREAWCQFLLALEDFHITDINGNILNKRQVFERYYEDPPYGNTFRDFDYPDLALIMSGMHSEYALVRRSDQVKTQDEVSEIIRDYLRSRAIVLARSLNVAKKFDPTVSAMVEAMFDILENYHDINRAIKEKARVLHPGQRGNHPRAMQK